MPSAKLVAMKPLLRPYIVAVGIAALALVGWGTASASTGSLARHHSAREVALTTQRSTESPEVENEAAEPLQEPGADAPEAAEDEADEPAAAPTPPAPASAPPTTSSRTFDLVGGTVTFTCTGNTITLTSAVPNGGFSIETETEDQEIRVRFESDAHRSEIRAGCSGGQVVATEIREESD